MVEADVSRVTGNAYCEIFECGGDRDLRFESQTSLFENQPRMLYQLLYFRTVCFATEKAVFLAIQRHVTTVPSVVICNTCIIVREDATAKLKISLVALKCSVFWTKKSQVHSHNLNYCLVGSMSMPKLPNTAFVANPVQYST